MSGSAAVPKGAGMSAILAPPDQWRREAERSIRQQTRWTFMA
jgi:hypothetical protein